MDGYRIWESATHFGGINRIHAHLNRKCRASHGVSNVRQRRTKGGGEGEPDPLPLVRMILNKCVVTFS